MKRFNLTRKICENVAVQFDRKICENEAVQFDGKKIEKNREYEVVQFNEKS